MPEDTKKEAKTLTVTVNSQPLVLVEHEVKRGRNVGASFYKPKEEDVTYDNLVKYYGADKVRDAILVPFIHRFSLGASKEAQEETKGDVQAFGDRMADLFTKLSERAESLKALKERLDELLGELGDCDPLSNQTEFLKIATSIKNIKQAINEKKAKDEEPDSKDENAASAPAAA